MTAMSPGDVFAAWLRTSRNAAGVSQQQVANALKAKGSSLAQSQVAKIERGERPVRLDEAVALAGVFGSTIDAALGLRPATSETVAEEIAVWTVLLSSIRAEIDAALGGAE